MKKSNRPKKKAARGNSRKGAGSARGSTLKEAKIGRAASGPSESREITSLKDELATTRESLQTIIEEQESNNELLKSANEKIQSSNKELHNTSQALETAKEQLQSVNKELATLNEELLARDTELSQANDDLTNLLANINVGIVLLGGDLGIRRCSPMAERILNLVPSGPGRRLSDLNRTIPSPDLDQIVSAVITNLTPVECEVQDRDGRRYSLRVCPYRTRENKIEGAVILLMDSNDETGERFNRQKS